MGERVAKAAADVGAGAEEVGGLLLAYARAMEVREGAALSENDPDFLHPGRTVLILVDDLGETDAKVLSVGALAESRRGDLRVDSSAAESLLAEAEWWRALPPLGWGYVPLRGQDGESPDDERLLEELITAPLPVQEIVLAEALDQIRHAHLWSVHSERQRAVAIVRRLMHPLATRVSEVLARRYAWWLRRVGPALEGPAPATARGRAPSNA